MDNNRINRMRAARGTPTVVLQEYNNLRSKIPGKLIFSFEGFEDTIYYEVMARKSDIEHDYGVLVCRGKDRVLGLRELLSRNKSEDAKLVRYFVDHDFDHLKGQAEGKDIYCTTTYSFENEIVGPEVLRSLLLGEFRCTGSGGIVDIERAESFFKEVFGVYLEKFFNVNLAIYALRTKAVHAGNVENDLKKYASLSLDGFRCDLNMESVRNLTGASKVWSLAELENFMEEVREDFEVLDPMNSWRGKFHLAVFQKLICLLKEDRGRKSDQRVFSSRAQVDASFEGNIVRSLSSITDVPSDLRLFFRSIEPASAVA